MSQVSQSVSQKNPTSAHSQQNHNDVCLSYIFTYQQLSDSTLGLAWTANVNKGKDLFNLTTFYWFINDYSIFGTITVSTRNKHISDQLNHMIEFGLMILLYNSFQPKFIFQSQMYNNHRSNG